ncbi:MAG: hypothetical protein K2X87_19225 [Gemmataceae bacterium]|nr:hypothetical protein [Gemmataceae bacterium]
MTGRIFDGLLTPPRDLWEGIIRSEVEDIVGREGYSRDQKVDELMGIIERERGRVVAEER